MKIHTPFITRHGAEIQISAKIEMRAGPSPRPRAKMPETLWFRFPAEFESLISADADPFAVALLLLAMQNREPLEIEGTLSRKLVQGLSRYQKIFHSWYPRRFGEIEIRSSGLRDDSGGVDSADACAFSGGVDSFYTLLRLHGTKEPASLGKKVTLNYALFMAGFDMPLHLTDSIGALVRSYQEMMAGKGVHWVVGSTNVRDFVNPVDWTNAHGQALAASALFFKQSWRRFYVPSSYIQGFYPKWGTHPELDRLLSTESLEFIHDGAQANRVTKLQMLSEAPESFERLRVCWIQDIGLKNCGECEKCVRTMVALSILGRLSRYKTFATALTGSKIRGLTMRTHQARVFARELIGEAMSRRKFSLAADLSFALSRRWFFYRRHLVVKAVKARFPFP